MGDGSGGGGGSGRYSEEPSCVGRFSRDCIMGKNGYTHRQVLGQRKSEYVCCRGAQKTINPRH